jgi:hypothetical protein
MIEKTLNDVVAPFLDGRFFPGGAEYDTPRPYGYYNQIGGKAVTFIDNAEPSQRNAVMQINIWADTAAQASLLMQQIGAALRACPEMVARPFSEFLTRTETDLGLYGAQQDFTCWKKK